VLRSLVVLALLAATGCGASAPVTGDPTKKVTWGEFQKMDAEQQDDPYVLDNLDDDAKAKLAAAQKQKAKKR
jgi:predicted small lipoprotein YifL